MAFICILFVAVLAFAGGGQSAEEEEELVGLFQVMGSLLEDPEWAEMHPLLCTDTPWPGIECELLEQTWTFHVTKIHIGPDVSMSSHPCKASARFSDSLVKLKYLKTLSLISCFTDSPVSLPESLFGRRLPYLEHLSLGSNTALVGEIPPSISNLENLKILCLRENNLTGEIPKQIGKLKNLQELDLSRNNLTGRVPEEIGDLGSLAILDLSCNSLQGSLPPSMGRLKSLEKMDLSFNNGFHSSLPLEFGDLKMLSLLDASHNLFTGPMPDALSDLQQLQYLIMDQNPLNAAFPAFTASLSALLVLSFSGCGLKGPISITFSNSTNLTALSLDNNGLTGSVPPEIGLLPNLHALNLSRNRFSGELSFPRDFIDRLGMRLDIRDNNGLCTSYGDSGTINGSSRLSRNPICSSVMFSAPTNKTFLNKSPNNDGDDDMRPDISNAVDLDKMLPFFLGLFFYF